MYFHTFYHVGRNRILFKISGRKNLTEEDFERHWWGENCWKEHEENTLIFNGVLALIETET